MNPSFSKIQLLTQPIQEGVCENLTFEEAIKLRDALAVPTLNCTVTINDRDGYVRSLKGVNKENYELYINIRGLGSVQTFFKAVVDNQPNLVRSLVQMGIPIDVRNQVGNTALIVASEKNLPEIVRVLLELGADYNILNGKRYQSAIGLATDVGSYDSVKMLLDTGINPDLTGRGFFTPLFDAISNDYTQIAKLLLEAGANPNGVSPNLIKPLERAVERNNLEIAQLLVEKGAYTDIRFRNIHREGPLLILAVSENLTEMVEYLLTLPGISPNVVDSLGNSPLSYAIDQENVEMVETLLKAGAEPKSELVSLAVNKLNKTIYNLLLAAIKERSSYGAYLNALSQPLVVGLTKPLTMAAEAGNRYFKKS